MPSLRSLVGALVAALALTLVAGASAAAGPDLTRSLKAGGLVVVLPARRHRLLEARPGSRRRLGLLDAAEPLRPGPRRRARDRARRAPARAARRQGLLERVLPHARDRAARVRPRDRPSRAPQHDRGRARRRLARADPRRAAALRHEARGREADRARHARRRRPGDVGTDARGGRGDRLPAAREQPLPRRRTGDAAASGGHCADRPRRPPSASASGVPGARRNASSRRGARARRDGLVHGPEHRQARPARPEDGTDDGDPARRGLGAARRDRRAGRRRMGDRRGAQRDRPGRPRYVRLPRLPAARLDRQREPEHGDFDKRGILWFTGRTGSTGA